MGYAQTESGRCCRLRGPGSMKAGKKNQALYSGRGNGTVTIAANPHIYVGGDTKIKKCGLREQIYHPGKSPANKRGFWYEIQFILIHYLKTEIKYQAYRTSILQHSKNLTVIILVKVTYYNDFRHIRI